eukprot:TRINITY_DN3065_c0_g5_i1.p5 TRINITY_DN3065_c0_g5~~TRINITY_DN3065_c0_g5_i1.p5  ORF type:complete len:134 (+),score=15.59 TRINITY_DN3065_c0_g5_i1:94-495(+)
MCLCSCDLPSVRDLRLKVRIASLLTLNWPTRAAAYSMTADELICDLSTRDFSALLKDVPETSHCTAHSVKHGVLDHLLQMRADGRLGAWADEKIARLCKHRAHSDLPDVTLGYSNCAETLAIVLGTGEITRLL